jgi:MFS family permease
LYRVESEIAALDHLDALETQALNHPDEATEILATHPAVIAASLPPSTNGERAATTYDYRNISIWTAIKELWHMGSLRWFIFGQAVSTLFLSLLGVWAITFFRRYHGLSAAGASGVVSLLSISLMFGAAQGGRIGDRLVARGTPVARVKLIAIAQVAFFAFQMIAWGTPQLAVAVPFFLASGYVIGFMGSAEGAGLTAVVVLDTVVPHLRGRAIAVRSVLMVGSTAVAPIILGVLSDAYGLRQSLMMMAPAMVLAALCTVMGGRHWIQDFTHAQREAVRQASLEHEDLDLQTLLDEDLLMVGATDMAATNDALTDRATRN